MLPHLPNRRKLSKQWRAVWCFKGSDAVADYHTSHIINLLSVSTLTYQCLLLEEGCGSIKDKDGFDAVIEELADAMKEKDEVCVGHWLTTPITHTLNCLIQPNAHI